MPLSIRLIDIFSLSTPLSLAPPPEWPLIFDAFVILPLSLVVLRVSVPSEADGTEPLL